MCGDWNFVIDTEMECKHYLHINNPRSRQVSLDYIEENEILDIWRVIIMKHFYLIQMISSFWKTLLMTM